MKQKKKLKTYPACLKDSSFALESLPRFKTTQATTPLEALIVPNLREIFR